MAQRIGSLCSLLVLLLAAHAAGGDFAITKYGVTPDDQSLDTAAIQAAIDACFAAGGGTVTIPQGEFRSGALTLRSDVALQLAKGAKLVGSDDFRDYGAGAHSDSFLHAKDAKNIRIFGEGEIDGADCRNPKGEEGFRGPHAILLTGCRDIAISGITIRRSANYAIYCRDCQVANIDKVTIRAGHDGLHAQNCRKFTVQDCDFRTGDDAFAGCDNVEFRVGGCRINSSCNAFRLGCDHLLVKDCKIWGPGESEHKISKRTNMLSAFVHFAPQDRNPKLPSDHWLIENVTIDNADSIYEYDFERGPWQQGQPALCLNFERVTATRIVRPIRILGDAKRRLELTLHDCSIALGDGQAAEEVIKLKQFGLLELKNVTLHGSARSPLLRAEEGNTVRLSGVRWQPEHAVPHVFDKVDAVENAASNEP